MNELEGYLVQGSAADDYVNPEHLGKRLNLGKLADDRTQLVVG